MESATSQPLTTTDFAGQDGNGSYPNSSAFAHIDSVLDTWYTWLAVVGIVDCIVGVLLNAFLLLTLLTSRTLRGDMRNILIANLAVADVIVDAFCQPLTVEESLRREWVRGCYLHIAVQIIYSVASLFVSVWIIACLDALLLVRVTRFTSPLTSLITSSLTTSTSVWKQRVETAVKVVVVVAPWLVSLVVILPVTFTGLHAVIVDQAWTARSCKITMEPAASKLLNNFFFFLPCGVILLLLLATACVYLARRRAGSALWVSPSSTAPPTPSTISTLDTSSIASSQAGVMPAPGDPGPFSAYVTASLLTLVLMGGMHVYQAGEFARDLSVGTGLLVRLFLSSLQNLKSTVLPLVWLLMLPDVRARARHLLAFGRDKLRRVNTIPAALDASVAYRNLPHD